MIQPSELRLYNWVKTITDALACITSIGITNVRYRKVTDAISFDAQPNYLYPIELTGAVLKCCKDFRWVEYPADFTADSVVAYYEATAPLKGDDTGKNSHVLFTQGDLTPEPDVYVYFEEYGNLRVKHLHELQNLFYALTGREMDIDFSEYKEA